MSAIIVVCVEGVLTLPTHDDIRKATPQLGVLKLISALAEAWPIAFLSSAPEEEVKQWLRSIQAPTWCWVATAPEEERSRVILRMLAQRQDRAQFVIAGDSAILDTMGSNGISLLRIVHAESYRLADWRQASTWEN